MVVKKKTKKKKVTKKTAKKTTKKVAKKTTKKVAKKTTKKVAKKTIKKVAKKSPSKTSQKKSKKVSKKSSKKQVKKTTASKARTTTSSSAAAVLKSSQKLKRKEELVAAKKEDAFKNVLDFLRGFDFLASDSDDCSERKCDNPATTGAYCRLHYIKNWKEIKKKEQIFSKGTLIQYIEQLIDKFSVNVVSTLVNDMSDEKHFYNALKNMNIDVAEDFLDDADDSSDESDIPLEAKSRASLYEDE